MKRGKVRQVKSIEVDGKIISVGDSMPMPPSERRKVNPAHFVDHPARGPKGIFRNGSR